MYMFNGIKFPKSNIFPPFEDGVLEGNNELETL